VLINQDCHNHNVWADPGQLPNETAAAHCVKWFPSTSGYYTAQANALLSNKGLCLTDEKTTSVQLPVSGDTSFPFDDETVFLRGLDYRAAQDSDAGYDLTEVGAIGSTIGFVALMNESYTHASNPHKALASGQQKLVCPGGQFVRGINVTWASATPPTPEPTSSTPTPTHTREYNRYEKVAGVGTWGGKCTCPDGQVYNVGDLTDSCEELACFGGVSGDCSSDIPASGFGMSVTCAATSMTSNEYVKMDGLGDVGGQCTCPDGQVYYVANMHGDDPKQCLGLACFGGEITQACNSFYHEGTSGIPPEAYGMGVVCAAQSTESFESLGGKKQSKVSKRKGQSPSAKKLGFDFLPERRGRGPKRATKAPVVDVANFVKPSLRKPSLHKADGSVKSLGKMFPRPIQAPVETPLAAKPEEVIGGIAEIGLICHTPDASPDVTLYGMANYDTPGFPNYETTQVLSYHNGESNYMTCADWHMASELTLHTDANARITSFEMKCRSVKDFIWMLP